MNGDSFTQLVRLVDVFFVGPLLIHAGMKEKFSHPVNAALAITGILTITYNGGRYLQFRSPRP